MVHSRREKNQENEKANPRKKQTRKERNVNLSTDQQQREEGEVVESVGEGGGVEVESRRGSAC